MLSTNDALHGSHRILCIRKYTGREAVNTTRMSDNGRMYLDQNTYNGHVAFLKNLLMGYQTIAAISRGKGHE